MANFDESRGRSGSRSGQARRSGSRGGFGDRSRGRSYSDRESRPRSRDRGNVEMTKVICSSCGDECEVPFKPTSSKPVFCSDCFSKKDKESPNRTSNRDLDIINEKLNKIMKALEIK